MQDEAAQGCGVGLDTAHGTDGISAVVSSFQTKLKRRSAATGLLALALATALPCARAQEDPAGLSALLTPLIIVGRPIAVLHGLFSGETFNRHANETLQEERRMLSLASRPQVPVQGLYVGRIPMQKVLKDSLGHLAIPSVEMDSPAAGWLLDGLDKSDALAQQAAQHPYVRASVAEQGDSRCVPHGVKDWTREFPFPGHRCLALEFVDSLTSDLELRFDTSRVSSRHLEWQIVDRGSHVVKFTSPFWPAYPERKGSYENSIVYGFMNTDYSNALALALEQLSPAVVARDDHGVPLALRWIKAKHQVSRPSNYKSIPVVLGEMEPSPAIVRDNALSWAEKVDQSYASQAGRMVADLYAILPTRDLVMRPGQMSGATYFVFRAGVYAAQISGSRIFIMKFGDDALVASAVALELDKAPQLGLCTEAEKLRCSTVLDVASISPDSVTLDIHVLGWKGQRGSYPVSIPGAWLVD